MGGLSPVSISIVIKGVFPMSSGPFENMSSYSSHSLINCCLYLSGTFASSNTTFLCLSTSAGEVINFFSRDIVSSFMTSSGVLAPM